MSSDSNSSVAALPTWHDFSHLLTQTPALSSSIGRTLLHDLLYALQISHDDPIWGEVMREIVPIFLALGYLSVRSREIAQKYPEITSPPAASSSSSLSILAILASCYQSASALLESALYKITSPTDKITATYTGLSTSLYDAVAIAARAYRYAWSDLCSYFPTLCAPTQYQESAQKYFTKNGMYILLNLDEKNRFHTLAENQSYITSLCLDAILGGAALIQLRCKNIEDKTSIALARACADLCRSFSVPFLVNDRADLSFYSQSTGVHVGQTDAPPMLVRQIVGKDAVIGLSCHSRRDIDEMLLHHAASLTYAAFGPVFLSPTKQGHAPTTGMQDLAHVVARLREAAPSADLPLPLVAIGGFTDSPRVADAAFLGVNWIAVVSAFADGADSDSRRWRAHRLSLLFHAAQGRSLRAA